MTWKCFSANILVHLMCVHVCSCNYMHWGEPCCRFICICSEQLLICCSNSSLLECSPPTAVTCQSRVGCPSKLVSIRNNRNWNRNMFWHYSKQNVCFGCFASIPKQRVSMFRLNRNKQKTKFLQKIFGFSVFFSVFSVFFGFFLGFFGSFWNSLFRFFDCFASIPKQRISIDPKQTEDPPKQFKREYIWVFFRKFRVVSFCFGLFWNSSVCFGCFGCFDIGSKHRNKPKLFVFGFTKKTETNPKQILFRFVSVLTENYFCLFRGHPSRGTSSLGWRWPWRSLFIVPYTEYLAFSITDVNLHKALKLNSAFVFEGKKQIYTKSRALEQI